MTNRQLSLFDIFESNNNISDEHDPRQQQHDLRDTNESINRTQTGAGTPRENPVRSVGATQTANPPIDDSEQNPDRHTNQPGEPISSANDGTDSGGTRSISGNGESLAGNYSSAGDITVLKELDASNSFNKRLKLEANTQAILTLKNLKEDKRAPNLAERRQLLAYSGFGGIKQILLNPLNSEDWQVKSDIPLRKPMQDFHHALSIFNPQKFADLLASAKRGIISSYYTPVSVIEAIYASIAHSGFTGGTILEPAAGTGKFISALPQEWYQNSSITAIEIDSLPATILQNLYPNTNVLIQPFEKCTLPENHYDLIISNVPFGSISIYDSQLEKYSNTRFQEAADNLHNYYFSKSIFLAKPNGLICLLTSRFTLDSSKNNSVRSLIHDYTEFLGAIRLPDTAFKSTAGTEVVTDIIFLRKLDNNEKPIQKHRFVDSISKQYTDPTGKEGVITYNEYYHDNPQNLLGQISFGGLYDNESFNLVANPQDDIASLIQKIGSSFFNPTMFSFNSVLNENTEVQIQNNPQQAIAITNFLQIGNLVSLQDNNFGIITPHFHMDPILENKAKSLGINTDRLRSGNLSYQDEALLEKEGLVIADFLLRVVEPIKIRKEDIQKVRPFIELRNLTKEILNLEIQNFPDHAIEPKRTLLASKYAAFVKRFGNLLDKNNQPLLTKDADCYTVCALETLDRSTNTIKPSDILYKRTINPAFTIDKAENLADAILISLEEFGKVNMNRISQLLQKPIPEIMSSQVGEEALLFKTPEGIYETREEYLSGNIVAKIAEAKKMTETDPAFFNHLEQLKKVLPKPIPATDIYAPIQAKWIPSDFIADFIYHITSNKDIKILFQLSTGLYKIQVDSENAQTQQFATKRKNAQWIFSHFINGIEPVVKYTIEVDDKPVTMVDAQDTQFAKEIYRSLKLSWDEWKYADKKRRDKLSEIYNLKFNNTVLRSYDGSHMKFPGLMNFVMKQHQKDNVFRQLVRKGGIADHKVGAGKTLVLICTAMEMRRLGIAHKPMIIGLKSQIPQLFLEFKKAYPLSKVLFPTEKDFTKENRKQLLSSIATNNWDCIIISHDQFNLIQQPVSIQEEMIKELSFVVQQELAASTDKNDKKSLEKRLYKYEQKLALLADTKKDKDILDFSQLGIDMLMVDESQEYKNLEFTTMKKNIRGLGNVNGSKKAFNLLIACRHLQKINNGDKGILFASGTPISNSMAEMYLLFKYLTPARMDQLGFNSFDQWAANFANDYSDLEYYMGKFKEVHRFREFANLPELITMYREIADVRNKHNLDIDEPDLKHHLVKIQPSESQLDYIEMLQSFIETKGNEYAHTLGLTAGYDSNKKVNPSYQLLAINFAKKLSMDPRLIHTSHAPGTKIATAADNIFRHYQQSHDYLGTQLVFSDIGTPKSSNSVENLYNFMEGNYPLSDMQDIFGDNFFEKSSFPALNDIKTKLCQVLDISPQDADLLIAEANQSEQFNVYNALKKELVVKGIPEDQIAFIHDFKTRKNRNVLYTAVNEGSIRILLGSTIKLGTGVNVQQRIVAVHHLDISWKPSNLEQRNGRAGRQGNWVAKKYLNNNVPAFYYATERTLDASMYNIVDLKAKFIAQTKLGIISTRSIKDVGDEDVDMGSMAAELSGDPIFKEKATLTKEIAALSQLQRSFLQKKYDTEDSLRKTLRLVDHYEKQIQGLNVSIPLLDNIQKDKHGDPIFHAVINKLEYHKIGDATKAILNHAASLKSSHTYQDSFTIGTVWGFEITLSKNLYAETGFDKQVISPTKSRIGNKSVLLNAELSAGLQIKEAILAMPAELAITIKKLNQSKDDIVVYEQQLKESSPYTEPLDLKTKRLGEVDQIISQQITNKPKKPVDGRLPGSASTQSIVSADSHSPSFIRKP